MSDLADLSQLIDRAMHAWRPPPKLALSEWADAHFFLSAESAAEAGRWRTLPYQRGIMDAITDPRVERVTLQKSARIGYTKIINAAIGYYMHQDPCPILVVQPTVLDANGYSKEEIAPMIRDCPVLAKLIFEDSHEEAGPRDSGNTILHKSFPGGVLSMVGANSGAGFRRVSRRLVIFDEVDGYPASAGSEGDQIRLGVARTQAYWNRKILAGSTPLLAGASRIEQMFQAGDQRRFFVPCPSCGHMAPLVFRGEGGHMMKWPEAKPEEAFFSCQKNGCVIEHHQKREMIEAGEWRAAKPFQGHASFHIWAAYSYAANATWADIAREFLDVKDKPEALKTFVNTWLGETWKERGEAPEWERLYNRREGYAFGSAPAGVLFLTAGVDVQKDRFVYEVVGWGAGKESWSVDIGVLPADTSNEDDWSVLDELLNRSFPTGSGQLPIQMLAMDSGYNTNTVYGWVRRYPRNRVIAVKGESSARMIIGAPTAVDVNVRGKRYARGCKVWPVGVDVAKSELYGWLSLERPKDGGAFPQGFCHFPEYDAEYFKQITAEHLVLSRDSRGFARYEWQLQPGRENHYLDCRVYARAAASLQGLDRMPSRRPAPPPKGAAASSVAGAVPETPGPSAPREGGFLGKGRQPFLRRGKKWL